MSRHRAADGTFRQSIVTDFPARCFAELREDGTRRAPKYIVLAQPRSWSSFGQPFVAKAHLKLAP